MNIEDTEACYRAVKSRDRRFDGVFFVGVTSTGIYCRPSCPAVTPAKKHATFHRSAAAAQAAGFRACKRCRPDATPGSPDWDVAADVAGRAMRLVRDGLVERDGVEGLADRLGYTPRHLQRLLVSELGAGPLALARARRALNARTLIETTVMPFGDVAFAAGFASIRQFNDTVREVYAATPTQLRRGSRSTPTTEASGSGHLELRLPVRQPFAGAELLRFLAAHVVAGVERCGADWYERTLDLPHGFGRARLTFGRDEPFVRCALEVKDLRDLGTAVERCRRLLDADADPVAVDDELGADAWLARLVRARPGLRVPGSVDGAETAVRAVIGQQVSVAGASTVTARLVEAYGAELPSGSSPGGPRRLFPTPGPWPRSTRRSCRCRGRAAGRWCAFAARSLTARSSSTGAPIVQRCAPVCWRCRASARGPLTTSRCVRSATPMSSSRPTSASAVRSPASATHPTTPQS